MNKRHKGSCHCGAIQFVVDMDVEASGGTRCNCSVCNKTMVTGSRATPGALTVTQGKALLSEYPTGSASRFFCSRCGVHLYGAGHVPEIGGDFLSVNLNALDDVDVGSMKIGYFDGRHDNWQAGLREQPWPIFTDAKA
jgi:hypothetical protein